MQGLRPLYRYFEFSGRSGRAEFWQFIGLYLVALFMGILLDLALGGAVPIFTLVVVAGLIVPGYAVATRRLHDRGYSGWWQVVQIAISVLGFLFTRAANLNAYTAVGDALYAISLAVTSVQVAYSVFLLVQLARVGDPGTNRFGPPPSHDDPAPTFGDIALKVRAQAQPALQPSVPAAVVPSAPAAAATLVASDVDPVAQIERLAKLREAGTLTDEEFQMQKTSLLARL